jgi:hypothetical protein
MSAATQTKIFGIRLGIDPKILVGGLIALAATLFWYNSRGDEEGSVPASVVRPQAAATPASMPKTRASATRRTAATNGRGAALRMRTVDATRGDVDPTLRLDLLTRLQNLQPAENGRNLFELGPAPQQMATSTPITGPTIMPKPIAAGYPQTSAQAGAPAINIALKYYGFVRPAAHNEANRGFFLDGDNVVVALEGEMLKQRYLVVALTPNSARLEDVNMKQGQTLPVVPEAMQQ